jgi:type VI secretion system protein ImpF
MAELTSKDRLQPALLDRLTDMNPGVLREPPERRIVSMRQLREGVLRDLSRLLNASRYRHQQSLLRFPDAARSTLNYGLPDLTGKAQSAVDESDIATAIAQAIRDFEPRIMADTLIVKPVPRVSGRGNTLAFLIEGDLWAQPYPERLYVRTELDLEDGQVVLNAQGEAGAS